MIDGWLKQGNDYPGPNEVTADRRPGGEIRVGAGEGWRNKHHTKTKDKVAKRLCPTDE